MPPMPACGGERSLRPWPWGPLEPLPADLPLAASDPAMPPLLLLIDRRRNLDGTALQALASCLSAGERERHDRYRLSADRQRFLLGRGGLRRLLAAWLDLPAAAVPLESGPHGKPHCPGGPPFNVSHSGDLILLALHPCRPVGVDVEALRPALDWRALAQRLLSPEEQAALEACAPADRPDAFLSAWCRLEARLKARGDGLAGLEALRAHERASAAAPARAAVGEANRTGATQGGMAGADEQLWDVAVPHGYRAAVVLAPLEPGGGGPRP